MEDPKTIKSVVKYDRFFPGCSRESTGGSQSHQKYHTSSRPMAVDREFVYILPAPRGGFLQSCMAMKWFSVVGWELVPNPMSSTPMCPWGGHGEPIWDMGRRGPRDLFPGGSEWSPMYPLGAHGGTMGRIWGAMVSPGALHGAQGGENIDFP